MEIHVHIHDGSVKEGRAPSSPKKKSRAGTSQIAGKKSPSRKRKPMTRKTQLAINRGRKAAGLKPIKWKKKGV